MNMYVLILAIYLILITYVGWRASKKVSSGADWAVAGRSLGVWESATSVFTTVLSAVSFIGYMGYYYQHGWAGWWNWAGTLVATILFAGYFAARIRRFGGVTISDFLEKRYGGSHAFLAAILILVSTVLFTMAQLVASANIINVITGIPYWMSVVGIGTVFLVYTVIGGMVSVAWVSSLSAVLILIGVYALMFSVLGQTGGMGNLHLNLYEISPALLDPFKHGEIGPGLALSWIVTWGIGNFGLPQIVTRFNSCKDEKTARMSQGLAGILYIGFYLPLMIVGLGMRVLMPGIENTDTVASIAMLEMVPPIVGGLVLAAIIGAAVTTSSSILLQAGTVATGDIYKKHINKNAPDEKILSLSKITTVIVGILAIFLSLFNSATVLQIQANMVGVLGSMLAMAVIIGFAWKRSNSQGGMAGMVVGIVTAVIWYALGQPFGWMPILPAIITSTLANVIVSLMTEKPSDEITELFFAES